MKRSFKIVAAAIIILLAVTLLVRFQARRILSSIIESQTKGLVQVSIGSVDISWYESRVEFNKLSVQVQSEAGAVRNTQLEHLLLDVASVWDFLVGGTLIIEELICETGTITLVRSVTKPDRNEVPLNLKEVWEGFEQDVSQFQINDLQLKDISIHVLFEGDTTSVTNFNLLAGNLNLDPDSVARHGPWVKFYLPAQTLTLTPKTKLKFDSLFFTSTDNSIQLNRMEFYSTTAAGAQQQVHTDRVRLAQIDFKRFFNTGTIGIDSVLFGQSNMTLHLQVNLADGTPNAHAIYLPDLDVGNVQISDLSSNLFLQRDTLQNEFVIGHASLSVDKFRYRPDSNRIIYSPRYDLIISQYNSFLSNRSTQLGFDTIHFQKHAMSLLNFRISKAGQKEPLVNTGRFELRGVDWYDFLVKNTLTAEEAVLYNPEVNIVIEAGNTPSGQRTVNPLARVREQIAVHKIIFQKATATIRMPERKRSMRLEKLYTTVLVDSLFSSNDINKIKAAVNDLSFATLRLAQPDLNGWVGMFSYRNGAVNMGSVFMQAPEWQWEVKKLRLKQIGWDTAINELSVYGLVWDTLNVRAGLLKAEAAPPTNRAFRATIRNLVGGYTHAIIHRDALMVSAAFAHLHAKEISMRDSVHVQGIDIQGNSVHLTTPGYAGSLGTFAITDIKSSVRSGEFQLNRTDTLAVTFQEVTVNTDLATVLRQSPKISEVKISGLAVDYSNQDSVTQLRAVAETDARLRNLQLNDGHLLLGQINLVSGPFRVRLAKKVDLKTSSQTETHTMGRRFDGLRDSLTRFGFQKGNSLYYDLKQDARSEDQDTLHVNSWAGDEGSIRVSLSDIKLTLSDSNPVTQGQVDTVKLAGIVFRNTTGIATLDHALFRLFPFNTEQLRDPKTFLESLASSVQVSQLKGNLITRSNRFEIGRLDYQPVGREISIQDFYYRPLKDKLAFLDEHPNQTNYMEVRIGQVGVVDFDAKRLIHDSVLHIRRIDVQAPDLDIARDKTKPFMATQIKYLPTNQFQKIGFRFAVDSIQLKGGEITYQEKSRITGQEGTIRLSRLQGIVRNVKNDNLATGDSLCINASSMFMDSARVIIGMKESYFDTLGGFVFTTQVSPFHTSILNKALIPLVSVDFKSGFVDTLMMRAIGREHLSLGSMKFLYRNLKVEFLNKEDTSRHSIKNQLMKFAANNFVIKANNSGRIGKVFYERDRNRAVFQYWIKMILSGVTTSVGAKSNRKQLKKYLRDLNQKKLPPIQEAG